MRKCPCGKWADNYDLFCDACMDKMRDAFNQGMAEFNDLMEAGPLAPDEELCTLDDLIVRIVRAMQDLKKD